jgi:signal transduction histidine kinase
MHLGLDVHHEVLGPLDAIDDVSVLRHLLFALRELMLNVVRHAEATVVNVRVELADRNLHLTVTDNGKGPGDTANPGHGLQNLSDRARRLGGDFTLQHAEPHGSVATWRVPLLTAD